MENRALEQYFFTPETAQALAGLAGENPCWLCTPTAGIAADRGLVLDIDSQFHTLGNRFIKYDMHRGLHSRHQSNGDHLTPLLEYHFDTVVCDPPFSIVPPAVVARNINALLNWDGGVAYICYPKTGEQVLGAALLEKGLHCQRADITLEYKYPPRNMGVGERREIILMEVRR